MRSVAKWWRNLTPGAFFLIVAVPVGLLLSFLTPPFEVPDEQAHLARAYQISEGGLLPQHISQGVGGHLPRSVMDISITLIGTIPGHADQKFNTSLIGKELALPLKPDDRTDVHFENTALYSPVVYVPSAVGIAISRVVGATPLVMLYVGRVLTVLAWIGMAFFAIRLTPIGKWVFVVISLAPMALFQAASVSADAITLGLSFVTVAWFARLAVKTSPITKKQWLATCGLLLILGFVKQPYALLGLLFVALPSGVFSTKAIRFKFIGSVLLSVGIGAATWGLISRGYFAQSPFLLDKTLMPDAQLQFVITHPLSFLHALYNTHVLGVSDVYLSQMVGVFGWLDVGLPIWVVLAYVGCLLLALGTARNDPRMPLLSRLALVGVTAATILAIDVLLYLYWNTLKSNVVGGIQGRYYLTILPAVVLAFAGLLKCEFLFKKVSSLTIVKLAVITIVGFSLVVIFQRYY